MQKENKQNLAANKQSWVARIPKWSWLGILALLITVAAVLSYSHIQSPNVADDVTVEEAEIERVQGIIIAAAEKLTVWENSMVDIDTSIVEEGVPIFSLKGTLLTVGENVSLTLDADYIDIPLGVDFLSISGDYFLRLREIDEVLTAIGMPAESFDSIVNFDGRWLSVDLAEMFDELDASATNDTPDEKLDFAQLLNDLEIYGVAEADEEKKIDDSILKGYSIILRPDTLATLFGDFTDNQLGTFNSPGFGEGGIDEITSNLTSLQTIDHLRINFWVDSSGFLRQVTFGIDLSPSEALEAVITFSESESDAELKRPNAQETIEDFFDAVIGSLFSF